MEVLSARLRKLSDQLKPSLFEPIQSDRSAQDLTTVRARARAGDANAEPQIRQGVGNETDLDPWSRGKRSSRSATLDWH